MQFLKAQTNRSIRIATESIVSRIPRQGMIGYSTNSNIAFENFMKIPSYYFDFQIHDFSGLKDKSIEEKIKQTGEYLLSERNLDLYDPAERQLVLCQYNGDGAKMLKSYPKNIQEAIEHEKLTGGLNLFINFQFPNKVPWFIGNKIEQIPEQISNVKNSLIQLENQENEFVDLTNDGDQNKDLSELLGYYQKKGLLMNFDFSNDVSMTENYKRFFFEMVRVFKF